MSGVFRISAQKYKHTRSTSNLTLALSRNVSSAGDYGRRKLRECEGLVDALIYLVRKAIEKANIDNKSVENCVCILRNLSYRAQEVDDPNYDKRQLPIGESRAGAKPTSDNLGCFGASKASKRKDGQHDGGALNPQHNAAAPVASSRGPRTGPVKGMDLLWQPEVSESVSFYGQSSWPSLPLSKG